MGFKIRSMTNDVGEGQMRAGGVAERAECLPSMLEAPGSLSSMA